MALVVAAAFADFLAANPSALGATVRILRYYAYALGGAMAWALVVALICRAIGLSGWRGVLVAAVHAFMLFQFDEVQSFLTASIPAAVDGASFWVWIAMTLLLSLVPFFVVRKRQQLLGVVAIAAVLLAIPARQVLADLATKSRVLEGEQARFEGIVRIRPNVYWIVLDGYPRADILRRDFDFDNAAFLENIERRGYTVQSRATSNYATSLDSVANTVGMSYRLTPGPPMGAAPTPLDRYAMVRGRNASVAQFRRFGYRYVHFSSGYDNMTLCSNEPDACVTGSRGLDEVDVALLSRTPYMDESLPRGRLTAANEQAFVRGSVADLEAKLPLIQEVPAPFFVYAHILMPHPPMRVDAECREIPARPDLRTWDPGNRGKFTDQIACVNRQTLQLLDRLASTDPEALVVVQADHGSAFSQPFARPHDQWTPEQAEERFAILSAVKLPGSCSGIDVPDALTSVNTFRVVFSCLTGTVWDLLPPRHFVSPYEPFLDANRGQVVEYQDLLFVRVR